MPEGEVRPGTYRVNVFNRNLCNGDFFVYISYS